MEAQVTFEAATVNDLGELVAIRIEAMRESLERVGRFDAHRARERFAASFAPECTWYLVQGAKRVGFVVVRTVPAASDTPAHMLLDHLYIRPAFQRRGTGAAVVAQLLRQAVQNRLPVRVGALRGSASNTFYLRQGFLLIAQGEFDNYYEWRGFA